MIESEKQLRRSMSVYHERHQNLVLEASRLLEAGSEPWSVALWLMGTLLEQQPVVQHRTTQEFKKQLERTLEQRDIMVEYRQIVENAGQHLRDGRPAEDVALQTIGRLLQRLPAPRPADRSILTILPSRHVTLESALDFELRQNYPGYRIEAMTTVRCEDGPGHDAGEGLLVVLERRT